MIQDAHVARHDFVFQYSTSGYIDTITMIGYDNHSALEKVKRRI